ncbi:lytic murein transglycosylase [Kitasatospora sp. NPDC051914]|uniref:lytic transglycosylase domain-containing protein n=1 Tax=Kitasatospora sp. NPDC051914 TaxID=3154945 RepID=UPI00343A63FD
MPLRFAVCHRAARAATQTAAVLAAALAASAPIPIPIPVPTSDAPLSADIIRGNDRPQQADSGFPLYPAQPAPTPPPGAAAATDGPVPIPGTVLTSYQKAEQRLLLENPACHLTWPVLAGIGQVESGHARNGAVTTDGTTIKPILGPVLNGNGFAAIADTDQGRTDGSPAWDRAIGPMQFIPSTWARWGADGNSDGRNDPNNVFDAALAAGRYLCADHHNLATPDDLDRAILSYNHSNEYLATVRSWINRYTNGTAPAPGNNSLWTAPVIQLQPTRPDLPAPNPVHPRPTATAPRSPRPTATTTPPTTPAPRPTPAPPNATAPASPPSTDAPCPAPATSATPAPSTSPSASPTAAPTPDATHATPGTPTPSNTAEPPPPTPCSQTPADLLAPTELDRVMSEPFA